MAVFKGQTLAWLLAGTAASAQAAAVEVVGWPLPRFDQATPDMSLGDDPVGGRQACPPLTRLNLAAGRSEELLVRRVAEEFRDESRGSLWRMELRTGIYWWNGSAVTSDDIAQFVRTALPDVVEQRGAGLWKLPDHDVKADGPSYVVVRWKTLPDFGPFVLNDAPFYRPVSGGPLKYECAGLYRPVTEGFGVTLKPTPGYKFAKALPEVRVYRAGFKPPTGGANLLELRYADKGKADACKQSVELPYATMVLWNTRQGPTADKEFRKLLTQLVPRGVLAGAGTNNLGQVAAAPVPRLHPGYDPSVRAKPFDMRAVSEGLNRLGYKRKTSASPRLDTQGKPLQLVIETQAGSAGLAEKVIADAYSAVGINVTFRPKVTGSKSTPDGVLASFALDWPRVSFLGNFHGDVSDTEPFWSPHDKQLDKLLEAYALTLTQAKPDFALLGKVQARLADLEPATVVLQHRACVVAGSGLGLVQGISPTDPDWFRQLIL